MLLAVKMNGVQRRALVSCLFRAEAMSNSEKIKHVALATLLSYTGLKVSGFQVVSKKFHLINNFCSFLKAFHESLLGLALPAPLSSRKIVAG